MRSGKRILLIVDIRRVGLGFWFTIGVWGVRGGDREEVVEGKGRRWEGQVWDGLGVVGEGE